MTNPTGTILTGLISSAVISDCGTYRYRLTRIWDKSKPILAWVMLNPSTADASTDDPTIRRCIAFAKAWGFGGITVINLYALRATDPKQLWQHPDPIGPENDAEIAKVAADHRMLIVIAWGSNATPGRAADVMRILANSHVVALGWTKSGQPRHPLYVRADTPPMRADIPPRRP
ncbi:uncharacterized protein RMCC_1354 [Mycolicibacterium canariasense]|uniref:DUF1643 domain-containing protein n=1 Tax=Mycolicibacterium canariasense TaxID=228230 RepID=A0A100WA50_MYCCR|nr:DUF1643 domain-containing protein [Mycolicibacterium canariasense]MCV7208825.1 DUF1643 domain-containing protein [Mycolicibacterium canariasense]ORV07455.1 hypothetical protein AWB94_14005 [Mycolicibacterium canariasense]GAS94388.1 uncharacterized protein RMCC_1354 [Mycolicibacterium canariasense]